MNKEISLPDSLMTQDRSYTSEKFSFHTPDSGRYISDNEIGIMAYDVPSSFKLMLSERQEIRSSLVNYMQGQSSKHMLHILHGSKKSHLEHPWMRNFECFELVSKKDVLKLSMNNLFGKESK